MRIISRKTLAAFYSKRGRADAKGPCEAWFAETKKANWTKPQDIIDRYPNGSILKDNRFRFELGGNNYRLIVKIHYNTKTVYIRFIGTHAEYDKIDANEV